jgi:hypothetical protein
MLAGTDAVVAMRRPPPGGSAAATPDADARGSC